MTTIERLAYVCSVICSVIAAALIVWGVLAVSEACR